MKPFAQSTQRIAQELETSATQGLTHQQASARLERDGPNILPDTQQESWLIVFLRQFQSPLIYILLIAAAIIFFLGQDHLDAFIISGVLLFNAIIGTIQEGRTRNILQSLKRFIKSTSIVIRDGKKQLVDDSNLVVGDLIVLQEGQRVPADARIVESNNMQIDESILTGESSGVHKTTSPVSDSAPVAEQTDMVFRGTYILSGSGLALVTATGLGTQIGKIHISIEEIKTTMPLKVELERLSYVVLFFIFVFCVFLFFVGFWAGKPLDELLVMLTALFICVVPEGLPVVMTLVLVTGVYRMAKQNVLVKNMQAVEALGRTDIIVIDKTGTLTRNEMVVSRVVADGTIWDVSGQGYYTQGAVYKDKQEVEPHNLDHNNPLMRMAYAASLLNSSEITPLSQAGLFDIKGDPTEAALFVFSQKLQVDPEHLSAHYTKLYEIPFNPTIKYHASFYEHDGQGVAFISGAPEIIFARCQDVSEFQQQSFEQLLDEGFRVVAIASKTFSVAEVPSESDEQQLTWYQDLIAHDLTLLGLFGIQDSIRSEVKDIIQEARNAGIKVIMATGDHQQTALYVAKQVGMFGDTMQAIDGPEFNKLDDQELLDKLDHVSVFSRVSPDDKMRIIKLFHQRGNIVAMTGDGINDAPSLVAADLGIAMGQIGTEVAKQASDMVLLDDSFVNIINAVEQGRHIFYTLKRVVLYFFATNMGEILIVLFALVLNAFGVDFPLPITAAQILWLNLVTDGFLDVALSMEPKEQGLLKKSWLQQKIRLVDTNLMLKMMFMAVPMGIGGLWVFFHYYQTDLVLARTMTLMTLAMFQWFNAWNCRSENKSVFQLGFFANKWLIVATLFVLFLQVLLLHVPFMQMIFKTVPLTGQQWAMVIAVSSPIFVIEELRKLIVRRWFLTE